MLTRGRALRALHDLRAHLPVGRVRVQVRRGVTLQAVQAEQLAHAAIAKLIFPSVVVS
jgi:hypothetical protein